MEIFHIKYQYVLCTYWPCPSTFVAEFWVRDWTSVTMGIQVSKGGSCAGGRGLNRGYKKGSLSRLTIMFPLSPSHAYTRCLAVTHSHPSIITFSPSHTQTPHPSPHVVWGGAYAPSMWTVSDYQSSFLEEEGQNFWQKFIFFIRRNSYQEFVFVLIYIQYLYTLFVFRVHGHPSPPHHHHQPP